MLLFSIGFPALGMRSSTHIAAAVGVSLAQAFFAGDCAAGRARHIAHFPADLHLAAVGGMVMAHVRIPRICSMRLTRCSIAGGTDVMPVAAPRCVLESRQEVWWDRLVSSPAGWCRDAGGLQCLSCQYPRMNFNCFSRSRIRCLLRCWRARSYCASRRLYFGSSR